MGRGPLYILQAVLVALSTVVALNSFLGSNLFTSFSKVFYSLLRGNTIYESIPYGKTIIVSLAVTIFFAAVVLEDLRNENFGYIQIYNLVLFMPEVLSFSRVNYLNLLGLSGLFTATGGQEAVIATGLVIVLSFCVIELVSRERKLIQSYRAQGLSEDDIHRFGASSIRYTLMIGGMGLLIAVILLGVNLVFGNN